MQNLQNIAGQPTIPRGFVSDTDEMLRLVGQMPPDSELVLHGQSWETYERLLESLVDPAGLRIAYDGDSLQIMTLSTSHEKLVRLLEGMIRFLSLRLNIEVESYGSATIKLSEEMKGLEPDACFYIQNVDAIGGRSRIDFNVDPMPDVAVEIDIYNTSLDKLSIYSSLGIPEVWRFHRRYLEIYKLDNDKYERIENSIALPRLTAEILTSFINRSFDEKQSVILKDFDAWLTKD